MPYYTQRLLVDADGKPIPQYYDPVTDTMKPMTKEVNIGNFPDLQGVAVGDGENNLKVNPDGSLNVVDAKIDVVKSVLDNVVLELEGLKAEMRKDQRGLSTDRPLADQVAPGTTYWSVDTDPHAKALEVSDGVKWIVIGQDTPEPPTDYLFRFDATTIEASPGTAIGEWEDISGNGYTLTNSGSARPTFEPLAFNGKPALRFGGSHVLHRGGLIKMEYSTLFSVVKPSGNGNVFASGFDFGTHSIEHLYNSGMQTYIYDELINVTSSGGAGPMVYATRYDGSECAIFTNGVLDGAEPLDGPLSDAEILAVGAKADSSNMFSGDIAEIICYPRALSNDEIDVVNAYLTEKWGI